MPSSGDVNILYKSFIFIVGYLFKSVEKLILAKISRISGMDFALLVLELSRLKGLRFGERP